MVGHDDRGQFLFLLLMVKGSCMADEPFTVVGIKIPQFIAAGVCIKYEIEPIGDFFRRFNIFMDDGLRLTGKFLNQEIRKVILF